MSKMDSFIDYASDILGDTENGILPVRGDHLPKRSSA